MKKTKRSLVTKTSNQPDIVEAATHCINHFGLTKFNVADVAKELGITRQAVYKRFGNRQDILSAVLAARLDEIMHDVTEKIKKSDIPFPDKITGLVVNTPEKTRLCPVVTQILGEQSMQWHDLLLGEDSPIRDKMLALFEYSWNFIFEHGRKQKLFRSDKTDEELGEWIRNIQFLLLLRDDLPNEEKIALIHDFLFPSIFTPEYYYNVHLTSKNEKLN